jgi:hypothetical protein
MVCFRVVKYSQEAKSRKEAQVVMTRFYDPRDAQDLARVEAILKAGGIEYFLRREPVAGLGPMQVHVAEEDLPRAEELLLQTRH